MAYETNLLVHKKQGYWVNYVNIKVISYIPKTKINQFAKLSKIDHTDDNLIKINSNYQYPISFWEYL